jgi:hypothetical protein
MDNHQFTGHPLLALCYTIISALCGISAILIENLDWFIRIGTGIGGMLAAFMAIRYHYYATKEKIQSLKSKNP